MVAVTTDSTPWLTSRHGRSHPHDRGGAGVAAPTGPAVPVGAAQRLLVLAVAIAVVVVVAVSAAAFGRLLDSQRGIPASPAETATAPS